MKFPRKQDKNEKEKEQKQKGKKKGESSHADWGNRAFLAKAFVQEIPRKRHPDPF
jgi:hypothetical protein